jgi:predicted alpha/beta superfamily hydrolase
VGHSLGGLFASYTLLQEPAPFQRYIIGSPSIWWDNKAIMDNLTSFSNTHIDLPARVFIGVGENEGPMVTYMQEMADKLASYHYPGLTLTSQIFESETHLSVIPFFISRGLRAVYA